MNMMDFEWSYIFPRSRINLSFVVCFIFLRDLGWNSLGLNLIKKASNALGMHTCPWYLRIMVKRVERALQLLDHHIKYFNMSSECTARVLVLHRNLPLVPTYF